MKIRNHSLRWWIDPWYRRKMRRVNKILKQGYGPIIISGLYEENLLMKRLREQDDSR